MNGFIDPHPMTPSVTAPRPPQTGLANAKCYAAEFRDCSPELSAEHFVSRSILEQIADGGNTLLVRGTSFARDEPREVSARSASARILCKRHNSALSPLDATANRLFRDLFNATQLGVPARGTYCGEDVERWMLKTLVGLMRSGVVSAADRTPVKFTPPRWMLDILFCQREFNSGAGLGVFSSRDPEAPVAITVNSEETTGVIYGIRVCLLGINFHLMTAKRLRDQAGTYYHRPRRLESSALGTFDFSWLPGKAGPTVELIP